MSEKKYADSGRVHILPESIAHKIAAGEVIQRPASVVRELMDNSIDAGSTSIDVSVIDGGMKEIRVTDNGRGMSPEDMELCFLPHATSKITHADDLLSISTMGFRGEALSSIAASSRLEVVSAGENGDPHRIIVDNDKLRESGPWRGAEGTTVSVQNLFHNLPARKRFLKSSSVEQKMCRREFIEKALPFPEVSFRFSNGDKSILALPAATLQERVTSCYGTVMNSAPLITGRDESGESLKITALLSYPEIYRKDRRYITIYINNRKVDEFGLVQAVHYGYGDFLPGGRFPYAFIFITVDPEQVDFNIHPAKKEVRLKNMPMVHHAVSQLVRSTLHQHLRGSDNVPVFDRDVHIHKADAFAYSPLDYDGGPEKELFSADSSRAEFTTPGIHSTPSGIPSMETIRAEMSKRPLTPGNRPDKKENGDFRYMGQIFGVFLLALRGDTLYIIDQHAAHERILYEKFSSEPPVSQELLVPFDCDFDADQSENAEELAPLLRSQGIDLRKNSDNEWVIYSFPSIKGMGDQHIREIIEESVVSTEDPKKILYSRLSCHAAVKEGELLSPETAVELIRQTFELELPRCPHGRPVWISLPRDELFTLIGRDV